MFRVVVRPYSLTPVVSESDCSHWKTSARSCWKELLDGALYHSVPDCPMGRRTRYASRLSAGLLFKQISKRDSDQLPFSMPKVVQTPSERLFNGTQIAERRMSSPASHETPFFAEQSQLFPACPPTCPTTCPPACPDGPTCPTACPTTCPTTCPTKPWRSRKLQRRWKPLGNETLVKSPWLGGKRVSRALRYAGNK